MSLGHGPAIAMNGLLNCLDFRNPRIYSGGASVSCLGSVPARMTLIVPTYYSYDSAAGTLTFDRSPSAPKHGGMCYTDTILPQGSLNVNNFLYNDHTWEVIFRINDVNPGNYDVNEGWSILSVYQGFHAGFLYTASSLQYIIWTTGPATATVASWTLGTSSGQIRQGQWYNIAVTRSGNVFTPYVNGEQLGTGTTTAVVNPSVTSNVLCLGASQALAAGSGSFVYYSKNSISGMRMYGRALSAVEIANNFNATRGRFGI